MLQSSINWTFIGLLLLFSCTQKNAPIIHLLGQEGDWSISIDAKERYKAEGINVYVGDHENGQPPILGEVILIDGSMIWSPRFPLKSDSDYSIFTGDQFLSKIRTPHSKSSIPSVIQIFPTSDTLPENLLKFYIHFSEPMTEIGTYENVTMLNSKDELIHQPFVKLDPPLWNSDHTRLTLWLDPGRVKRGLNPGEDHGPVLEMGKDYKLVISDHYKSAKGVSLGNELEKSFFATKADRKQVDQRKWVIDRPVSNSSKPLIVLFGESMDHALAESSLQVINDREGVVSGTVIVLENESSWQFIPAKNWRIGQYKLIIQGKLEDLAGNNLIRVFDRDLINDPEPNMAVEYILRFEIE